MAKREKAEEKRARWRRKKDQANEATEANGVAPPAAQE